MRQSFRGSSLTAVVLLVTAAPTASAVGQIAQERVDLDVVRRIRDEGLNRSQIPELARQLTDEIGPRLTGSPGTDFFVRTY